MVFGGNKNCLAGQQQIMVVDSNKEKCFKRIIHYIVFGIDKQRWSECNREKEGWGSLRVDQGGSQKDKEEDRLASIKKIVCEI